MGHLGLGPSLSYLPSRGAVRNWLHFGHFSQPTQALQHFLQAPLTTQPHPTKQPLIKQKEERKGGWGVRSERAQEPGLAWVAAPPSLM